MYLHPEESGYSCLVLVQIHEMSCSEKEQYSSIFVQERDSSISGYTCICCVPRLINFESVQSSADLEKLDDLHKMLRKKEIQGILI